MSGPGPSKGTFLGPALVQFFITLIFQEESQMNKIACSFYQLYMKNQNTYTFI